jgi:hypothetical protein
MPRYGSTDRRLSDRGADWSEGTTDVTLTEVREIHRLVVAPVWPHFPPENLRPNENPWRVSSL